ncbi:Gamma-glutamylputrescine oxidoreductase, partial [Lachnellula subtilissima]
MSSIQIDQQPMLPVPHATTPFWRTDLDELDGHRSTADLPAECDILIIGGGYAGIAAAYHLLFGEEVEAFAGKKVVLLEARQACSGATGRNGGHIRPTVYPRLPRYIEEYGLEAAEQFAQFERDHVNVFADLVEKEGIECDFELTRSFDIYTDPEQAAVAKANYLKLKEAGVAKSTIDDLEWTDADRAEEVSGVKGCVGCFTFTAASVWPYKLFLSLLKHTIQKGLNLQTHTPVTSISSGPSSSGLWTASTPRGPISAKQIIFATNGYTASLLPEYAGKIVPCRGICSRITCPPSSHPPKLDKTYGLRLPKGSHDYLIPRKDGSIVVGGARSAFFSDPSEWYNTVDDSTLIDPAAHYFDNYMQENFVGWEDSVWGRYLDGRDVFIAAGFEGHGMPVIWLTVKGVIEMLGGKAFEESGVPGMFRTTRERLESERDDLKRK